MRAGGDANKPLRFRTAQARARELHHPPARAPQQCQVHTDARMVAALPGVLYAFVLADRTTDVETHFECLSLAHFGLDKSCHVRHRMINRPSRSLLSNRRTS